MNDEEYMTCAKQGFSEATKTFLSFACDLHAMVVLLEARALPASETVHRMVATFERVKDTCDIIGVQLNHLLSVTGKSEGT